MWQNGCLDVVKFVFPGKLRDQKFKMSFCRNYSTYGLVRTAMNINQKFHVDNLFIFDTGVFSNKRIMIYNALSGQWLKFSNLSKRLAFALYFYICGKSFR